MKVLILAALLAFCGNFGAYFSRLTKPVKASTWIELILFWPRRSSIKFATPWKVSATSSPLILLFDKSSRVKLPMPWKVNDSFDFSDLNCRSIEVDASLNPNFSYKTLLFKTIKQLHVEIKTVRKLTISKIFAIVLFYFYIFKQTTLYQLLFKIFKTCKNVLIFLDFISYYC